MEPHPEGSSSTESTYDIEYLEVFREIDEYADPEEEGATSSSGRTHADEVRPLGQCA